MREVNQLQRLRQEDHDFRVSLGYNFFVFIFIVLKALFFFKKYLSLFYINVSACMSAHHVYAQCLWMSEEGIRSPGTEL